MRDQLERALSDKPGEADQGEIVARIKALRDAHTVEAAPERTKRQAASIEEAVTTRIMRGREPAPAQQPEQIEIPVQPVGDYAIQEAGGEQAEGDASGEGRGGEEAVEFVLIGSDREVS